MKMNGTGTATVNGVTLIEYYFGIYEISQCTLYTRIWNIFNACKWNLIWCVLSHSLHQIRNILINIRQKYMVCMCVICLTRPVSTPNDANKTNSFFYCATNDKMKYWLLAYNIKALNDLLDLICKTPIRRSKLPIQISQLNMNLKWYTKTTPKRTINN